MPSIRDEQRSLKIAEMYLLLHKEIKLINKLVYGQKIYYYSDRSKYIADGVMYLHQNSPQILVILGSNGEIDALDFKKLDISMSVHPDSSNECIVLRDFGTQCSIVYQNKKDCETNFQHFKQIKKKICEIPSETDSDILKNFIKADKNRNRTMQMSEFAQMLKQMRLQSAQQMKIISQLLEGMGCTKQISLKQFEKLSNFLICRKQFQKHFQDYTHTRLKDPSQFLQKMMKREQFIQFLKEVQKESKAKQIAKYFFINAYQQISFCDFSYYLLSKYNNVIHWDEDSMSVVDESKPLNKYYCYSSHNTYLTGNQVSDDSSADRYYDDLISGIRCVEIDTMDGSKEPLVSHRFTLTTNITFLEVLIQINNFRKTHPDHTPIILSIDNGCGLTNQRMMAKMLKQTFQQDLFIIKNYVKKLQVVTAKNLQYPSLDKLRGKVIVKCAGCFVDYQKFILSQKQKQQAFTETSMFVKTIEVTQKQPQSKNIDRSSTGDISQMQKQKVIVEKEVKLKINLNMLECTAMLGKGTLFKPVAWESVSLNETAVEEQQKQNNIRDVRNHVDKGWIRSYPKFRSDSSNFNPYPSFEMGIQMIALNSQYGDEYSCLMRAFFQRTANKCSGYRLRPPLPPFKPTSQKDQKQQKQLRLRPISGSKIYYDSMQNLNKPLQIQIQMKYFCCSADERINPSSTVNWNAYTQLISNNGFNPVFQSSQWINIKYTCDWLAFIGVKIEKAGIGFIPVEGLKRGIRFVELYDRQFMKKETKIFFLIE